MRYLADVGNVLSPRGALWFLSFFSNDEGDIVDGLPTNIVDEEVAILGISLIYALTCISASYDKTSGRTH